MRIAFIMSQTLLGASNGVVSQALTWKFGLETKGLDVILANPWDELDWNTFDAVHIFGMGEILNLTPALKKIGVKKIVLSPIYDSNRPIFQMNSLSRFDFPIFRMKSYWASLRSNIGFINFVLVRSDFEGRRIQSAFGVPREKIKRIPLSVRFGQKNVANLMRENFCLHVSLLSAETKNVRRLIAAAIRYQFELVLCGAIHDKDFKLWLDQMIKENRNLRYLGRINDDQLKNLYSRARVFALPSTMEGVGLVGLEAAIHGADVVVTSVGAPKEYYGGLARTVDPYDVDDIGQAIVESLNGVTYQPELAQHISRNYSINAVANKLIDVYNAQPKD